MVVNPFEQELVQLLFGGVWMIKAKPRLDALAGHAKEPGTVQDLFL
jgi:hypothetical protein